MIAFSPSLASKEDFQPPSGIPRVLKHLISSATPGFHKNIPAPPRLDTLPRAVIKHADLPILRIDGLLPNRRVNSWFACPSVFASTGWVQRRLNNKELCRAYDMPTWVDDGVPHTNSATEPLPFAHSLSPIVVTAVFRTMWNMRGVCVCEC